MYSMFLINWYKQIKFSFKKKKMVDRNKLNENIFEYFGNIDAP